MTNNPTEKALLARGFDSELAVTIRQHRYTLESLKLAGDENWSALGLTQAQVELLRRVPRPPIPAEDFTRMVLDSRWVCCAFSGCLPPRDSPMRQRSDRRLMQRDQAAVHKRLRPSRLAR